MANFLIVIQLVDVWHCPREPDGEKHFYWPVNALESSFVEPTVTVDLVGEPALGASPSGAELLLPAR